MNVGSIKIPIVSWIKHVRKLNNDAEMRSKGKHFDEIYENKLPRKTTKKTMRLQILTFLSTTEIKWPVRLSI